MSTTKTAPKRARLVLDREGTLYVELDGDGVYTCIGEECSMFPPDDYVRGHLSDYIAGSLPLTGWRPREAIERILIVREKEYDLERLGWDRAVASEHDLAA